MVAAPTYRQAPVASRRHLTSRASQSWGVDPSRRLNLVRNYVPLRRTGPPTRGLAAPIASLWQPLVDASSGTEPDEPNFMAVPPEDSSKAPDSQSPKIRRTLKLMNWIGAGEAESREGFEFD
jgi:hypothetical protein